MKKIMKTSLFLLSLSLFFSCASQSFNIEDQEPSLWGDAWVGTRTDVPYYPDGGAVYWLYTIDISEFDDAYLEINGQFPRARYMSINLYDETSRSPVDSLYDVEILADEGHKNPFTEGKYRANKTNYNVAIHPSNQSIEGVTNTFSFDPELQTLSLILRYYVPEGDIQGGVPLPELTIVKGDGSRIPAPLSEANFLDTPLQGKLLAYMEHINYRQRQVMQDGEFNFVPNVAKGGLYNNADNVYVSTVIERPGKESAIIKFTPPSYPASLKDISESEVRYWSLGYGDLAGYTYGTLIDEDCKIGPDGKVYVYISDAMTDDEKSSIPDYINLITWPFEDNRLKLIYRNMLSRTDFAGDMTKLPLLDLEDPSDSWPEDYIGEYNPVGILMDSVEFLADPEAAFDSIQ